MADGQPTGSYTVQIDPAGATAPGSMGESIKTGQWENGFCDCFTHLVPNCLMAWCCPCITIGQIAQRLGESYGLSCFTTFCGFGCCWAWHLRSKTRAAYNIPGSCCGDCCASTWCSLCVLTQTATHVKSYKPGSCDFGAPDTLPAFK